MPTSCSVPGCRSNYKNGIDPVTVFQFPSDEERRALWLRTIPRRDWVPGKRSVVCIKHFNPEDIVKVDSVQRPDGSCLVVPRTVVKLKADAVPCIFEPEEPLTTPKDQNNGFLEQGAKENQNIEEFFAAVSESEMPFFWKPENKRTQISPDRMKSAVLQVVVEGKSIRSAAKEHRIDRKTLGRYVQKFRNTKDEEIELKPNYSSAQIFTDAEEKLLEEYLTLAAEIHYGLTSKVARQIAYEHGIAHKKILPDNWYVTKCASYDWLRGFLHRHRSFSLKNPQAAGYEFSDDLKPKNKFIAEVFESGLANGHNSKRIADVDTSNVSSAYDPKVIANVDKAEVTSAYDSKSTNESLTPSVHNSKKVLSEQGGIPNHDPDCLLNTTGSSNFTPFCTCQYKSENHISITAINDVSDPEDIYILPTTDEPNCSAPVESQSVSEDGPSRNNQKRKRENSPESTDHALNPENELELKESKRTRRKRKL